MRYSGKLGIAEQVQTAPGVWDEEITEHDVVGDLVQKTENLTVGDDVNPHYATTTSVSVFARGVGPMDNSMIRYVTNVGKRWTIRSIVEQPPRIVLYLGEEYRGPAPQPAPDGS